MCLCHLMVIEDGPCRCRGKPQMSIRRLLIWSSSWWIAYSASLFYLCKNKCLREALVLSMLVIYTWNEMGGSLKRWLWTVFRMPFYSDDCVLSQFISLTRTFLVSHERVKLAGSSSWCTARRAQMSRGYLNTAKRGSELCTGAAHIQPAGLPSRGSKGGLHGKRPLEHILETGRPVVTWSSTDLEIVFQKTACSEA